MAIKKFIKSLSNSMQLKLSDFFPAIAPKKKVLEIDLESPDVVSFTNNYMTASGRVSERIIKIREKMLIGGFAS